MFHQQRAKKLEINRKKWCCLNRKHRKKRNKKEGVVEIKFNVNTKIMNKQSQYILLFHNFCSIYNIHNNRYGNRFNKFKKNKK
jgi:hypothetical protein